MILGYAAGLRYGPAGVAAGFSIALALCVLPMIFWATHGTPVTAIDALKVVVRPLLAILIGAGATLMVQPFIHSLEPVLLRLFVANAVLFGVYAGVLLFVMGQKAVYLGLIREIGIWPLAGRRKKDEPVGSGDGTAGKNNLSK
jgi:hypothetical protein